MYQNDSFEEIIEDENNEGNTSSAPANPVIKRNQGKDISIAKKQKENNEYLEKHFRRRRKVR